MIEEEIRKALRENKDLTISQLAKTLGKPRARVSSIVGFLAEKKEVELIPVATGKVVRLRR